MAPVWLEELDFAVSDGVTAESAVEEDDVAAFWEVKGAFAEETAEVSEVRADVEAFCVLDEVAELEVVEAKFNELEGLT